VKDLQDVTTKLGKKGMRRQEGGKPGIKPRPLNSRKEIKSLKGNSNY
jgi:hypothetical protein